MARVHSGARYAPKHGQQYGEGFQFRSPQEFSYSHGPWDSIMPKGDRDLPRNALKTMSDGLISEGMIKAGWSKEVIEFDNRKLLGVYEMEFSQIANHVIFWTDTITEFLHVGLTAVAFSLDYETTLTALGSPIVAVPWQNELYFSSTELGQIYKMDVTDGTVTAVAGTVGAEFLVMLDNNLIEFYKVSGLYYEVAWSVDGNPSDWAGYGAGTNPMPNTIGTVRGVEVLGDSIVILGNSAALRMSSTGFVPAFRFADLVGYDGSPHRTSTSDGEYAYYMNFSGKLLRYNMSQSEPVGEGEDTFNASTVLYFSKRLNRIVVSSSDPECTLLLDPDNGKWNSTLDDVWTHMADSPRNGGLIGSMILYSASDSAYTITILQRVADGYLQPELTTGFSRFPVVIHIHYVDIIFASAPTSIPVLTMEYEYEDGSLDTYTSEGQIMNTYIRYWFDLPAQAARFIMTRNEDDVIGWSFNTAITQLNVMARSTTDEQITQA